MRDRFESSRRYADFLGVVQTLIARCAAERRGANGADHETDGAADRPTAGTIRAVA